MLTRQLWSSIENQVIQTIHFGDDLPHKHFSYRVRTRVRDEDPGAYSPKVLPLGPFHRGNPSFKKMEKLKRKFTSNLLNRSHLNSIDEYVAAMRGAEERVRSWYPEVHDIDSNEFVEMMVFDGCFLIELFLKFYRTNEMHQLRQIFFQEGITIDVVRNDCLMIENQIPFFVLKLLFERSHIHDVMGISYRISTGEWYVRRTTWFSLSSTPFISLLLRSSTLP
ncbi:unnamed protein product [Spirodela intermedia]|uniref:Uncharacterized protein n=2 Tax=Spirodela intermedia TaxID=51605 RepID=A0A7I8IN63_SPIIN|nr:unnamed protein product [Spirodela intermedia]CAA6658588.1 unnamed protein product [Spirodela intermedia]CAA6674192.1 unnamed protein product [Spirodela intermedia]CAA6675715.1 unnamed protein product [Spirodela intermedia]CAA7403219.1 unnamed protein product [Spirodela intermedia]